MKKKQHENSKRWGLTFSLMLFVFGVVMAAMLAAVTIVYILYKVGLLNSLMERILELKQNPALMECDPGSLSFLPVFAELFGLMIFCGLLALALTWFFGKRALNPLRKVIDATHKVANGDFSVRVELKGIGELEELSRSFNKMAKELSTIETLRSDFINAFSHQFKTPLMSVEGFAELLKEGGQSPEEQQDYLDIIIEESKRLTTLATNTLTLSKYEHVEIVTDKAPFRLDEQVRQIVALIAPQWMAKGLAINVELDEVTLNGNEELTQQIWLNLLENAIKFSPQGSTIQIRLNRQGKQVRFAIQDEGMGMDEQAQAHCFDKFYQADTSRSNTGNGLGLAIVKRIVDLYGGSVEVQSEPNQGCTFIVIL